MKKTFKRVLSTVLALCVLLASATCLMGITASATDEVKAFGIELWSDGEKQFYFYDTQAGKNIEAAYTGINAGDKVSITFDYFTDSTGFSVRCFADQQFAEADWFSGYAQYGNNDDSYFDVGSGKVGLTYTATKDITSTSYVYSMMPYINVNGNGAKTGKVLYLWNVEITLDRADGEDVTLTTEDLQLEVNGTKQSATYDADDMKSVWSWTPNGDFLKFMLSGYDSWQTTTGDLYNIINGVQGEVGDTFNISFDYYVTGDADDGDFVVETASGWGADEFSEKISINKGRGSASKTFTINKKGAEFGIMPLIRYYGEGDATLNIWNIKFTKAGVDRVVHLNSTDTSKPHLPVTSVNALGMPVVETPTTDTTVYEWATGQWANRLLRFEDTAAGNIGDVLWGANVGETLEVSFDYYNPYGGAYEVLNHNGNGIDLGDSDRILSTGFGSYEGSWVSVSGDDNTGTIEPKILSKDNNNHYQGKSLYIWNIRVSVHFQYSKATGTHSGYTKGEWYTLEFTSENGLEKVNDQDGSTFHELPKTTLDKLPVDAESPEDIFAITSMATAGIYHFVLKNPANTAKDTLQDATWHAYSAGDTVTVKFDYFNSGHSSMAHASWGTDLPTVYHAN